VKARTVALRPAIPAVITVEVIALAAFLVVPPTRLGWWSAVAITVAALAVFTVTVHRRHLLGWASARLRTALRREQPQQVGAAVDVPCGSAMIGVRGEPHEAITMVAVTGAPYVPTFLRGSTVSLTENVVPLHVLTAFLDQPGGLRLAAIDVVNEGHRVRRGTGYPALYSTLLADRPAAGARRTWLIVRLDIPESVEGLAFRESVGAAAAAATDRIVTALRQEGVRARALSAGELDTALADLSAGAAVAPIPPALDTAEDAAQATGEGPPEGGAPRPAAAATPTATVLAAARRTPLEVGWSTTNNHPGYLSSYYFSPDDITTAALNQMWSLRSDALVQTIILRKDRYTRPHGDGPVLVSALVRTDDPQPPQQLPTRYLNPLTGSQKAALLRSAPAAAPDLRLPTAVLTDPAALQIPIGPTGVLVGAALHDDAAADPPVHRDDLVMWALTDADRATRIVMETSHFYVRQLMIRAAAAGERIAIYSRDPDRWHPIAGPNVAVVERNRPLEFVPSIVVNDRPVSLAGPGLASTVVTLSDGDPGATEPDIRFTQTSQTTVRIITATHDVSVSIVAFKQEQAFTG
jgi:type VII secretion protein EccE